MFRAYRLLITLLVLAALGLSQKAWASMQFPYLDKSKVRIILAPGQTKYGQISVENPTQHEKPMRVYLEDWSYATSADGAKEFVPAGSTGLSCAPWVSFNPAEFTVPPFGKQTINYAVKPPEGASGGHFAVFFFENAMEQNPAAPVSQGVGAGLTISVRTAALLYVEIEDTVKRTCTIQNLTLGTDEKTKSMVISADIQNTGNSDITAGGSYYMMDSEGMIFARGEFNDVYMFPGQKGVFTSNWKEKIPDGTYDMVLTIDIGKALEEAGMGRGPVITKEARIKISQGGQDMTVIDLK